MDALEAIRTRRSCRSYLQKPIEFDKLTAVLEAGHFAPSAGSMQDWKFILVLEKDVRFKIADHCMEQYWMASAPAMVVVCSDSPAAETKYGVRGSRLYTIQDCAAACENMLLAATALGLGSCWIGAFDEEYVSNLLGIPGPIRPQAILTLGYPAVKSDDPQVTDLVTNVFFNKYGNKIEKLHLVLGDYHVEVAKAADSGKDFLQRFFDKMKNYKPKLK